MTLISDLFWAYLVAITLLTITPGVDTLLVMRNTGRGGLRDGCVTSVGICSGLFIHATLSALGISLLLVETAWAFSALKWAGACYLVWLGIGSL
ncbi:MAG TPA: threonine transporter RhtB, partial [Marinobacter adhaerens]|nr:threonine transporter RhtB [Marinobacter adhaerens]HBI78335.1 threonine transporter RhtB [Marinobacter adhaerens]